MSSQKGNTQKARGQKHQNKTAFKNNLHDGTSWKRRQINSVVATGVCHRCKDAIDWKIQYKKYKPLSQPRTCNKCHQKTVKQAYYTICTPCAQSIGVCQKCGEEKEIAISPGLSAAEQASRDAELKFELKRLSERQRRTFFRLQQSGKLKAGSAGDRGDNLGSHDEPENVAASGDRGDNLESPDDSLSAESENESDTEIDVNVEVPFSAADTASVPVDDLCDPDTNNVQT